MGNIAAKLALFFETAAIIPAKCHIAYNILSRSTDRPMLKDVPVVSGEV